MRADPDGPTRHDLSGLRALAASGEPWNPEPWWWYFRRVGGERCPLINYSGGTEISGGIVAATTVEPQQPCAFAGPVPGMAADVLDEAGQPVRGRVGELVLQGAVGGDDQRLLAGPRALLGDVLVALARRVGHTAIGR